LIYLLEIHVLIDNMDKEEVKLMNNIVQYDPNHRNNEQEHFSFQFRLPTKIFFRNSFFIDFYFTRVINIAPSKTAFICCNHDVLSNAFKY